MKRVSGGLFVLGLLLSCQTASAGEPGLHDGWQAMSPREELRPEITWQADAGPDQQGAFLIQADGREALMGHLQKSFPVEGGKTYEFTALRKTEGIDLVRRVGAVRLIWLDQNGKRVTRDKPSFASYRPGEHPRAEPEFPGDQEAVAGWTKVAGVYRAPVKAAQVQVELHFRWGPPHSRILWSNIVLKQTRDLQPRIVRLATIHHRPQEG
ncbi:MAG TPA: carbon-nitrogen hydrolase family protein, partial [Planctomycetaceae bacterium]|nr:carbon-nitrogen hydrolase family protein [Planctomycetaceae bacterium]